MLDNAIRSIEGSTAEFETPAPNMSSLVIDIIVAIEVDDWCTPLIRYLENPGILIDRKVRRQVLKYLLLDHDLYRRTIDGLLLKCLGPDQSKIAMGEVHEGICGTHQSAHKMK